MMCICTVSYVNVKRNARMIGEPLKKFLNQLCIETAYFAFYSIHMIGEVGSAANVDIYSCESFFHWYGETCITCNAFFIAQRCMKCLATRNANIFRRMMIIYLRIPVTINVHIKKSVLCK